MTEVTQDDPLQGLHQERGEGYWPEVIRLTGMCRPGIRDHTRCLPLERNSLQTEAQVEDVQKNPAELICTLLETSGADALISLLLPCF